MKKYILSILVILFTLNTNQSFSQEVEKDTIIPVSLQEVVVSTPFKESLKNNVMRVNKLSLNDINLSNNPVLSFDKIPGLSAITTGPGILKPVIRGLSGNRVVTFTQNIRFENGQWGEEHGIEINPFGTQSVEVIKGPMSVLYGSDAIGGVIYISPDSFIDGNPQVEFGSLFNSNFSGFTNNLGLKGSVGGINYIVQGSYVDNGNFSTPEGEVENTFFENTDFKVALGYSSDKFISELRLNYSETNIGIPHGEEHDDHDENGDDDHDDDDDHDEDRDEDHEDEEPEFQALENTLISWKNTFIFNNKSELEITVGHTINDRKEFGGDDEEHDDHDDDGDDDDHGDDDHDEDHDEDHDDHDGEGAHLAAELKNTSIDLKYLISSSEKTEFVFGSSLQFQDNVNYGEEELLPDASKNDFGLFGLAHFHGKVWDLMIGLRTDYRRIQKSQFDETYSSLTTSLGLKTDLGNSGILRLNFSSGYRAPNLSELFADGVHHGTSRYYVGNQNLNEEKSSQIDFSISTFGSNSEFGFDLFANSLKDYIYLNPTGEEMDEFPVYSYVQDDANIFGGELYYNRQSSLDWLSYETSLEFLRGEKSNSDVLPFIAPLSLKQSFNLEFNNSSFELEAVLKGKKENVAQFETKTDSYFLLNLSGTYDVEFLSNDLKIGWSINNLTDKLYFDHMSRLKTMGIHEMGRNISVGINYQF